MRFTRSIGGCLEFCLCLGRAFAASPAASPLRHPVPLRPLSPLRFPVAVAPAALPRCVPSLQPARPTLRPSGGLLSVPAAAQLRPSAAGSTLRPPLRPTLQFASFLAAKRRENDGTSAKSVIPGLDASRSARAGPDPPAKPCRCVGADEPVRSHRRAAIGERIAAARPDGERD